MQNYKVIFSAMTQYTCLALPLISCSHPSHLPVQLKTFIFGIFDPFLSSNPLVPRPVSLQAFILLKYCRGEGRYTCEFSCRIEDYSFNIINQNLPNSIVSHEIELQILILAIYGQGKQFLKASFFFITCFS